MLAVCHPLESHAAMGANTSASMKCFAHRLQIVVLRGSVPRDDILFAFVDHGKNAIVRRHKILVFGGYQQGSAAPCPLRDRRQPHELCAPGNRNTRADGERPVQQIKRRNHCALMSTMVCVRIDFQDDALERANQVVVRSVIRRERNNCVGQWRSPVVLVRRAAAAEVGRHSAL